MVRPEANTLLLKESAAPKSLLGIASVALRPALTRKPLAESLSKVDVKSKVVCFKSAELAVKPCRPDSKLVVCAFSVAISLVLSDFTSLGIERAAISLSNELKSTSSFSVIVVK